MRLFGGAEKASETARRKVEQAGVPEADNGEAISAGFRSSLGKMRDAYGRARDTIDGSGHRRADRLLRRRAGRRGDPQQGVRRQRAGHQQAQLRGVETSLRRGAGVSLSGLGDTGKAEPPPALFPAPESDAPAPARRRGGQPQNGPPRNGSAQGDDAGRQLVFFGAEAAEPTVADLAGLLAGPGEVVRMGGTARLSVQVDAAWRVHVLVAELAARGLAASWEPTEGERHAVRTSYTRVLKPLAAAWLHGTAKRPPATFHLTGRRLRLWLAAAGTPEPPDASAAARRERPGVLGADRRGARRRRAGRARCSARARAARPTGSPAAAGSPGWPSWSASPPKRHRQKPGRPNPVLPRS